MVKRGFTMLNVLSASGLLLERSRVWLLVPIFPWFVELMLFVRERLFLCLFFEIVGVGTKESRPSRSVSGERGFDPSLCHGLVPRRGYLKTISFFLPPQAESSAVRFASFENPKSGSRKDFHNPPWSSGAF